MSVKARTMRLTLSDILSQIASSVNQETTLPTGDELTLWTAYVNRSIAEWANSYDWQELIKEYRPSITGTSVVTIALPTDFRKLSSAPVLWGAVADGEEWPEVIPEQQRLYSYQDRWVEIAGNPNGGYNVLWNPGTLSSGASISIRYFSMPTSLASPAQIPVLPDSQFLVDRSVAYILESRSDPRFQQTEAKARQRLLTMIENASAAHYNSYSNGGTPVISSMRRAGFRMGRD